MLIANPIYDNVFKFLMEDLEIAKGVISTIINTEIDHLSFQAQESITRIDNKFSFYHLDFVARIRQQDCSYKTVLIELQKTNLPNDIMRFRKYLGEKYRDEDEVILDNGKVKQGPIPIINIYLLGFYLSKTLPAVIKVDRRYIDVIHGTEITERNEFIECLSHDSYVIQIPALQIELKSRLEYVLSIFMQENFINKENHLKDYRYETEDTLMKKILRKLSTAAGNRDFLRQMEVEELAYRDYDILRTTIETSEKRIQEMETILQKNETEIQEKDKVLHEKDMILREKERQLLEKECYIKELQEKLNA
jgi:hypothetical protein